MSSMLYMNIFPGLHMYSIRPNKKCNYGYVSEQYDMFRYIARIAFLLGQSNMYSFRLLILCVYDVYSK